MRIIKPLRLGLLTRPYTLHGQHRLGVCVTAFVTLDEAATLVTDAEFWRVAQTVLDEDEAVDLGIPKPCGEFLVSGKAWSHDAAQPGACAVRVQVGTLEKSLIVTGDRQWADGVPTAPKPVAGTPLDWHHTWGGEGVEENPVGIGATQAPGEPRRLPNVESLQARLSRPGQTGTPVGLGPVSPVRPRRFVRAGGFDPNYLTQDFPGFPDSLDPHFFNAASPDQWWVGESSIPPGLPYDIWNMHPDTACLSGHVPDFRARCFIVRHDFAQDVQDEQDAQKDAPSLSALEALSLELSTLWFFPDREKLLMLFHGSCVVSVDDAADIELIMPALETSQNPRTLDHYCNVLRQRLRRDTGGMYALRDSDLVPMTHMQELPGAQVGSGVMARPQIVNARQRGQNLRRDMLARAQAMGHDPGAYPHEKDVPELQSLDALPAYVKTLRRRTREGQVRMGRQQRDMESRIQATFSPEGQKGVNDLRASIKVPPAGGPPAFGAEDGAATLLHLARQSDARSADQAGSPMQAQEMQALIDRARVDLGKLYRHGAHYQAAASVAPGGRSVRMRRRVESLMQGSRDLTGLDLTGIDLTGLDMSGARARGIWMENANLAGASLAGADLTDAVLTRANLAGTTMAHAVFTGANLGKLRAKSSSFAHAVFDATVLDGAQFEGCDFSHARLRECMPAGLEIVDCVFSHACIDNVVIWQESILRGSRFEAAILNRVVWLDCTLEDMDFRGSELTACAWMQVDCLSPLRMAQARLTTCCAVDTVLAGAVFVDARLASCNFRGIDLDGADFSRARLLSCDLSQASLRGAQMRLVDAGESLFIGSDLTGVDFRDADLIDALMQKSDYRLTDLRGANLFRADISQSRIDDTTRTTGAYIKQAKTLPRAPAIPVDARLLPDERP